MVILWFSSVNIWHVSPLNCHAISFRSSAFIYSIDKEGRRCYLNIYLHFSHFILVFLFLLFMFSVADRRRELPNIISVYDHSDKYSVLYVLKHMHIISCIQLNCYTMNCWLVNWKACHNKTENRFLREVCAVVTASSLLCRGDLSR